MYEKYLLQLEEAGKIRNLKERSINCKRSIGGTLVDLPIFLDN